MTMWSKHANAWEIACVRMCECVRAYVSVCVFVCVGATDEQMELVTDRQTFQESSSSFDVNTESIL